MIARLNSLSELDSGKKKKRGAMEMNKKPAFNPYLPGYEYIPDGEPYVFGDRVYVYGSHDESKGTNFCTGDYVGWSAPVDDLGNWRYEGVIYRKTQDPVNPDGSHAMYAPDVAVGPDGRYYLYYVLDSVGKISVAVCDDPAGKYEFYGMVHYENEDGSEKVFKDNIPFDPGVLVDDDGKMYLYYGFCPDFSIPWVDLNQIKGGMVVELKQDMITVIEPPKAVLPCFTNSHGTGFENHAFLEASSIRKINGMYYLIYSSQQMHELCYATSPYPDKGFVYGGVIISNGDIGYQGRKPEESLGYIGNNHGSLVQINGQWFIFYHRHTQATQFSRQGCAEPVIISKGGSIAQVEMTSCGLNGGPLSAKGTFSSHIACNLIGSNGACSIWRKEGLKISEPYIYEEECGTKEEERNQYIANITNGTKIGFKYFSFDNKLNKIILRLRGKAEGRLRIHLDAFDGILMGEGKISTNNDQWSDTEVPTGAADGTHGIFIVYSGDGYIEFDSFTFE
jgi:arabinoxylan arabinofuranohydrolase